MQSASNGLDLAMGPVVDVAMYDWGVFFNYGDRSRWAWF